MKYLCFVFFDTISRKFYDFHAGKSPTQKVTQLLQDMAAKGRAEKQAEQVADRSGGGFPLRRRDELVRGRSSQVIDYVSTLSGFVVHKR